MVPTNYYIILSGILFGIGVFAFVFKRNIITIFMSIELMLNAVNLAFVAFSQAWGKSGMDWLKATKARLTAFSISSMDMKMVMMLRLKMKANTPRPNRIALKIT